MIGIQDLPGIAVPLHTYARAVGVRMQPDLLPGSRAAERINGLTPHQHHVRRRDCHDTAECGWKSPSR